MKKKPIAVMEFSSSKVTALIAEESNYGKINIIGLGAAQYAGYDISKGFSWCEPEKVNDTIVSALEAAEKNAGMHIDEIYVGVPCDCVRVEAVQVELELAGADPVVTADDLEMLMDEASKKVRSEGDRILDRSPAWFKIDDHAQVMMPVGQKGKKLSATIGFTLGDRYFSNEVASRLKKANVKFQGFYSVALGLALHCIPEEERDATAILVDVGFMTTDVMVVEGDTILWKKNIPVGGAHITMDLTYALEKPFDVCEQIKRAYIFDAPEGAAMDMEGEGGQIDSYDMKELSQYINPRVDEILEEVNAAIKSSGVNLSVRSVVYMTGGGLLPMSGADKYASGVLGRVVRRAKEGSSKYKPSEVYASAVGLVEMVVENANKAEQEITLFDRIKSIFGKKN